jgi:hypothetical protein
MGKPQPLVSEVQHLIPTALYEDNPKLCNDSQITKLLWLWMIVHTGNSLTWFRIVLSDHAFRIRCVSALWVEMWQCTPVVPVLTNCARIILDSCFAT